MPRDGAIITGGIDEAANREEGAPMHLFVTAMNAAYIGINLAAATAAVVAGFQWLRSAQAAWAGNQAESVLHNANAAFAACLAAICQAAIASREFAQSIFPALENIFHTLIQ